jgi:hypothetical protein
MLYEIYHNFIKERKNYKILKYQITGGGGADYIHIYQFPLKIYFIMVLPETIEPHLIFENEKWSTKPNC